MKTVLFTLLTTTTICFSLNAEVRNDDIKLNINLSKDTLAEGYYMKGDVKVTYASSNPKRKCLKTRIGFEEDMKLHTYKIARTKKDSVKPLQLTENSFQVNIPVDYDSSSSCEYKFRSAVVTFCHKLLDQCYDHRIDTSESMSYHGDKEKYFTNYKACKEDRKEYNHGVNISYLAFDYNSKYDNDHLCTEGFVKDFGQKDYYNSCPGKTTNISFGQNEAPAFAGNYKATLNSKDGLTVEDATITIDKSLTVNSNSISFTTPSFFKGTMGSDCTGGTCRLSYNYSFSHFTGDGRLIEGTIYLKDNRLEGAPTSILIDTHEMLDPSKNRCRKKDRKDSFPTMQLSEHRLKDIVKI